MVKEFIDAVDLKNKPVAQDPFDMGVNFDDAYGNGVSTVAGLWGSTVGMQSPFESAYQSRPNNTLVERDDNLNPWGWDISTRTELPDDAWGNNISTRKPKKPGDGFNSGVGSF